MAFEVNMAQGGVGVNMESGAVGKLEGYFCAAGILPRGGL